MIDLTAVTGVSSVKAQAQGKGTIELKLIVNGKTYILNLKKNFTSLQTNII
jgi:hypothetical protein